jgi:hypothetical protein
MGPAALVRAIAMGSLLAPLASCGAADVPQQACDELAHHADTQRAVVLAHAGRACSVDADCVLATPRLLCHDDCGQTPTAVSRAAEPKLRSDVRSIETNVCGEFLDRGCQPEVSPCVVAVEPPVAVCRESLCELEVAAPP